MGLRLWYLMPLSTILSWWSVLLVMSQVKIVKKLRDPHTTIPKKKLYNLKTNQSRYSRVSP